MLILQIAGGVLLAIILMNLWVQSQQPFDREWDRRQAEIVAHNKRVKAHNAAVDRELRKHWKWRQWVRYYFTP